MTSLHRVIMGYLVRQCTWQHHYYVIQLCSSTVINKTIQSYVYRPECCVQTEY